MKTDIFLYILLMAITVFIIRVLPLTLIRKPIQNRFIRSFLYYVPYVTLSVMTVPAIVKATDNPISGIVALLLGMIGAYKELGLFKVTLICCISVLLLEMFI